MGYKIVLVNGIPEMTYEQDATIGTDMLLSAMVEQGAFFLDPKFGLPPHPRKMAEETPDIVRDQHAGALAWLTETGRAKRVDVVAVPDPGTRDRVNVKAEAEQPNGKTVSFETIAGVI